MNVRVGLLVCAAVTAVALVAFAATGQETDDRLSTAKEASLPDPLEAGWQGDGVCEVLHEDAAQRVLRCTFPPDGGHERHYHAAHFGYVIRGGRMRIVSAQGSRDVELRDDVTWTSEGIDWHEVENIGDTTSVYLIVESR